MKFFATCALACALAVPAAAGGLDAAIMEEEVVEEAAASSSRAGILVPLLAIILIGLAISNSDDPAPTNGPQG